MQYVDGAMYGQAIGGDDSASQAGNCCFGRGVLHCECIHGDLLGWRQKKNKKARNLAVSGPSWDVPEWGYNFTTPRAGG